LRTPHLEIDFILTLNEKPILAIEAKPADAKFHLNSIGPNLDKTCDILYELLIKSFNCRLTGMAI